MAASSALPLREPEIRAIAQSLHPDAVLPAARHHGLGDPVAGSAAAYAEARRVVRTLIRASQRREERRWARLPPEEAAARRKAARQEIRDVYGALGFLWRWQEVDPWPDWPGWRARVAPATWGDGPVPISDMRFVRLPRGLEPLTAAKGGLVRSALLRATSEALWRAGRALNRAFLPARGPGGAVRARLSPEVMLHVGTGPDEIRPVVLDPRGLDGAGLRRALGERLRALVRVRRHPLAHVGDQILAAWCRAGFIGSPAGAMVSDASSLWRDGAGRPRGNLEPSAPLIDANGVPIAIAMGEIQPGYVLVRITFDHRCLDAPAAKHLHPYLEARVPELVEAWLR